ncbi:MAG: 5-deoxy-glucuronate isomerase [Candidatus Limnocylindrales bacterium]
MTSPLLRRPSARAPGGTTLRIEPADAGWSYIAFATHRLAPGQTIARAGDDREVAVIVLEGAANVLAGMQAFENIGSRASIFEGPPAPVVLVEAGTDISAEALAPTTLAMAAAPAGDVRVTRLIEPAAMRVEQRGSGDTARRIHHLLPPDAEAGRLILVEVFTPGGNWSSYPPHKHDTEDQPRESYLEELYYYRFARPEGFAFQRVYSPDRSLDEALTPGDGDVVLVPRGYHPVGMPAGYDGYYLNVMAGPTRLWHFTLDPDLAWLMDWSPGPTR